MNIGLANATIYLLSGAKTILKAINTDSTGNFEFSHLTAGQYQITTTFVGYQSYLSYSFNIQTNDTTILHTIYLKPKEDSATVTVSAKTPYIQQEPDNITLNIASSPLAESGNVYDALLKAPGMYDQNGQLKFRETSEIQIQINGRPSPLKAARLKGFLSNMPASRVEKIVILTQPSARNEGTAGTIINIILHKIKEKGSNFALTQGLGAGNYMQGSTGLDFNYRNSFMNVYGGYSFNHIKTYNEDITNNLLAQYSVTSQNHEINTNNNNTYSLGTDIALSAASTTGFMLQGYYNNRTQNTLDRSILHQNNQQLSSTAHADGKASYASPTLNLYFETKLDSIGNKITINTDYATYNRQSSDIFTTSYANQDLSTSLKNNSPQDNTIYAVSVDFDHRSKVATWSFGLKSSFTRTDNISLWENKLQNEWQTDKTKTNHFVYQENIHAGYIDYSRLYKNLQIHMGIRAELTHTGSDQQTTGINLQRNYFNLFPMASLLYIKDAKNSLSFGYKRSIYRFNYNYVNPFIVYQNAYNYYQGNPDLQSMLFDKISLGYLHNRFLSLNMSFTHISRMISLQYLQGENHTIIQTYNNLNHGNYLTLSATLQKQMGIWQSGFTTLGGYARYVNQNAPTNNSFMAKVQWQNTLQLKNGWALEANLAYSAPMASGLTKIDALFTSGVAVGKSLFQGAGTLNLSVSDLFNTAKPSLRYQQSTITTTADIENESRFVHLIFKYSFGNKKMKSKAKRHPAISDLINRMAH